MVAVLHLVFVVSIAFAYKPPVRPTTCSNVGESEEIELLFDRLETNASQELSLLQQRGMKTSSLSEDSPSPRKDETGAPRASDLFESQTNETDMTLHAFPMIGLKDSCATTASCGTFRAGASCQCTDDCWLSKNCCSDYSSTCNGHNLSNDFEVLAGIGPAVPHCIDCYSPSNPSLLKPSKAPLLTFYMYRAQGEEPFPPTNSNLASLSGVLWYLHNEIVVYCTTGKDNIGEFGFRRYKKTRILRYKVTTRATVPLWEKGMNFGVRVAFDSAQNTGAWFPSVDKQQAYEKYGYVVGCNTLGEGPFPLCPSAEGTHEHYCPIQYGDRAIWYSLPGECPSLNFKSKTDACKREQPGGFCPGAPTGMGNCTWTYEYAGEVNLDQLVGIAARFKSYNEFCSKGCREYVNYGTKMGKGLCGISFWDNKASPASNKQRVDRVDAEFKKRYPGLPSDKELATPHCDFKKDAFYKGL